MILIAVMLCQAQGQTERSSIHGRVLDENRAAVSGARINAQGSRALFSVITDANGDFSLPLVPGEYALTVNAEGFAETARTVKVKPATSASLEILLEVAGSTATVTIMGARKK